MTLLLSALLAVALAAPPAAVESLAPGVRVQPLRDGFWLHHTESADGIGSNGLFAPLPGGGVLLVDTAWNEPQTDLLLDFAEARLGGVREAIVTHAHGDRIGGLRALRRRGVRAFGHPLTVSKAWAEGALGPEAIAFREGLHVDPRGFEVFYPGKGHTLDTIAVAFPAAKVLAGGCFLKSGVETGPGYMGEAYLSDWPASVDALEARYGTSTLIVPGHGPLSGAEAFTRTREIAQAARAAEEKPRTGGIHELSPAKPDPSLRYLFYVHGRILEQQGRNAVSPDFGRYEYDAILKAFASEGFEVISELRKDGDGDAFVRRLVEQITRLRRAGVPAERIAVVGASRGGYLMLQAAARLGHPGMSYVVLAGCGDASAKSAAGLRGRVLSIYDDPDRHATSCRPTFAAAPDLTEADEIVLKTGRDHGLLYQPYPEWLKPATAWARGGPAR